jgi:uncharacterized protein (DUF342 family)
LGQLFFPAVALNDRLLKLETQVQTDKAQLENTQVQLSEAKSKNRVSPTKQLSSALCPQPWT